MTKTGWQDSTSVPFNEDSFFILSLQLTYTRYAKTGLRIVLLFGSNAHSRLWNANVPLVSDHDVPLPSVAVQLRSTYRRLIFWLKLYYVATCKK